MGNAEARTGKNERIENMTMELIKFKILEVLVKRKTYGAKNHPVEILTVTIEVLNNDSFRTGSEFFGLDFEILLLSKTNKSGFNAKILNFTPELNLKEGLEIEGFQRMNSKS